MDISYIRTKIVEILKKHSDINREIQSTDDLREDLHLDSLDTVELILQIEKEFNIHIDDDTARNLSNVEDVCKLIEQTVSRDNT